MKPVFENKDVILRAGGISSLEAELERRFECQYPHGSWHSENFTLFRHEPAASAFAGPAITCCVISTQRRWQALRVRTVSG